MFNHQHRKQKVARKTRLSKCLKVQLIDDFKVGVASILGVGNWFLTDIDLVLKCLVSLATLVYIIMRCFRLNKNKD